MNQKINLGQPAAYRIRVQGALSGRWAEYFEDMTIEVSVMPDGSAVTTLVGCLADQAAVQGTLQKLYNLGFPLISAEVIEEDEEKQPNPSNNNE